MAGRGKSKQVCSEGLSQRLEEDRISQLPDPLICDILSHLPTKEAVTTSVLSTRWRSLWLWVPRLELRWWHFRNVNAFKRFGDRFFDSSRASCIDKVKLSVDDGVDDDTSYLTSWIDAAVKRKIQHLHVCCCPNTMYEMPLRLYTCETLVSLKLFKVTLDDVDFVSLPSLKTMHLKYMWYRKEAVFERLVSCCPVLEKLKIVGCLYESPEVFRFRVLSRSLKKLRIEIDKDDHNFCTGFVIDAPRLCFLSINDKLSESYIINDMDSNVKVDISLPFGLDVFGEASISSRRSSIRSFLLGISKVEDMRICRDTFKLICQYSKIELLPQFGYMSRLWVSLRVSDMNWLPTFLESCSNLKYLILVWNSNSRKMPYEELRQFDFSSVPECLLSSLEFVDIKNGISGHWAERKLVSYFLENSPILKKLTLRMNYYCTNEKFIVKEILNIPRRSITCQVVIC